MENKKLIANAIKLGAQAGLRGVVAPALASYFLGNQSDNVFGKQKSVKKRPAIVEILSGYEKNGKKYPLNPNRIINPRSLSRIASGAVAGAGLFRSNKIGVVKGLLLGGTSALAITVAGHYLQKYLHQQSKSKDPMAKAVGLLLTAGHHLLKKKA